MKINRMGIFAFTLGATCLFGATQASAGTFDEAMLDYRLGLYEDAYSRLKPLADGGHPEAMFWVGSMLHKGRGTAQNYVLAFDYYHRGAMLGNADAQNNLGLLYRDGVGVRRDSVVAYAWFSVASGMGNAVARANRDRISDTMSEPDIRRGQRMASRYDDRVQRAREVRVAMADVARDTPVVKVAASAPVTPVSLPATEPRPVPSPTYRVAELGSTPAQAKPERLARAQVAPPQFPAATAAPAPTAAPAAATAPAPMPAPKEAAKPAGTDGYMVQLGLFSSEKGIARIRRVLAKQGVTLEDKPVSFRDRTVHRLRVGPFATVAEARQAGQGMNKLFRIRTKVVKSGT